MKSHIYGIRVTLFVIIIIGLAALATEWYWVPSLVQEIISHENTPAVVQISTTTSATTANVRKAASTSNVVAGVDINILIGPTCPVQTTSTACADKPYETTVMFKNTATGEDVIAAKADTAGHISQALNPGTYTVRAESIAPLPRLTPVTFTVHTHARTKLTLHFDSGIR
ncbi:MAG: hypothetical protein JWN49_446 [Parcubacteria group bacterium]|nr:hypothetical protein [Parcubacteria group bacterium]